MIKRRVISTVTGVMNADAWLRLNSCLNCQNRPGVHDWARLVEDDGTVTELVHFTCPKETG